MQIDELDSRPVDIESLVVVSIRYVSTAVITHGSIYPTAGQARSQSPRPGESVHRYFLPTQWRR